MSNTYNALCTKCGSSRFKLFINADENGMTELVGSECIICHHLANYQTTFIDIDDDDDDDLSVMDDLEITIPKQYQ